jgi:hypothetical protein
MKQQIQQTLGPAMRPLLILACLILLLVLAQRVYFQTDMTANSRHTLLPQSVETLALFNEAIDVEVFINPLDGQREAITSLLEKYREYKSDLQVRFTDPALDPALMRKLNIAPGGEIFFRAGTQLQRITQVSETAVTMALQRLARTTPPTAVFVTGHGERAVKSTNNADIGIFAAQLQEAGFVIDNINLTEHNTIDTSNGMLVIASPLSRYLPGEVALILDYLTRGGNMLWLTEPASDDGLKAVELELGVMRSPGVVVDLASQNLAVDRPDFAVANNYSPHQATQGFSSVTLFPQASALQLQPNREWRAAALVQAGEQAWTETGALSGQIAYGDDKREIAGPFPLILALEREKADKLQKVLISGDGDFIADAWIANGGNRDLGNRLFNWTADDNDLVAISAPAVADNRLDMPDTATILLVVLSLLLIPAALFATGGKVWYTRRYG